MILNHDNYYSESPPLLLTVQSLPCEIWRPSTAGMFQSSAIFFRTIMHLYMQRLQKSNFITNLAFNLLALYWTGLNWEIFQRSLGRILDQRCWRSTNSTVGPFPHEEDLEDHSFGPFPTQRHSDLIRCLGAVGLPSSIGRPAIQRRACLLYQWSNFLGSLGWDFKTLVPGLGRYCGNSIN